MIRYLNPHDDRLIDNCPLMDDEGCCIVRWDTHLRGRSPCNNFSDMCTAWRRNFFHAPYPDCSNFVVLEEKDIAELKDSPEWSNWIICYCRRVRSRYAERREGSGSYYPWKYVVLLRPSKALVLETKRIIGQ